MASQRFDNFHDRFSKTTTSSSSPQVAVHRKVQRGAAPPSYSPEDAEGFYGRFSTTTGGRESGFGWVLQTGDSWGNPWQVLVMLIIAFDLVFAVVRPLIAEPMRVPSGSMSPTLQVHDRVLTNKLAYDFANPDRGDIAVFESVDKKGDRLVKRVVGLPGDTVAIQNGTLLVNGEPPYEPYKKEKYDPEKAPPNTHSFGPAVVPKNHVFVMGDNRANSRDSRTFGPVPTKNLVGEVSLRFWPPGRLGAPR